MISSPFLKTISAIFFTILCTMARSEKAKPIIIKPDQPREGLSVVVILQGYRGFPGFAGESFLPKIAQQANVAFISFPATTDLGDDTQQWSEEPVADHAYIQDRVTRIARENGLTFTRVGLIGFSQGAMVAGDIASRYPDLYSGALIMSPGGMNNPEPAPRIPLAKRNQTFVLTCMGKEHPGNVELTKWYSDYLKRLGATVQYIEYPEVETHSRPPDIEEKLPVWIDQILGRTL